ncbi:MAG: carboxypeptidase regulatory-like domain-containing protein, partial [Bacillota bacterium]|nr:carboxypeptidase regulatory-like domain-containing protein [Bacillota bacterium]
PTYTPTPTSTSTPTPKPTSTPTPTPTQPLVYKIEGYIAPDFNISLDSSTVKSGYKIEIMGTSLSAISDKNGYFVISNIPSGVYSVRISKQGYLSRIISNVIANNNVTIGTSSTPVLIWAGDIPINGAQDDIINMNDIIQLAQVFNTTLSSSNYLPQCDLNCDNTINIADVVIIAAHFNSITSNYPEFVPIYSK